MRIKFLIVSILLYFLVGANSKFTQAKRKSNKMLEVSLNSLPLTLDPTTIKLVEHFLLLQAVSQTLVRVSEEGKFISDLAEKWIVSDDLQSYDFILKNDLTDHLGKQVTAVEVKASFIRHFLPGSKSVVAGYLKPVLINADVKDKKLDHWLGIEVIDKFRIRFNLRQPYAPFLHVLTMPGFGVVSQVIDGKSIGTGPFKIDSFKNGEMILVNSGLSFGRKSNLKLIHIRVLNEISSIVDAIDSKTVDFVFAPPLEIVGKIKDLGGEFLLKKMESSAFVHLYFNLERQDVFKDPQFRYDFVSVVKSFLRKEKLQQDLLAPLDTFLPEGLLPHSYYKQSYKDLSQSEFKKKWKDQIKGVDLSIPLQSVVFSKEFSEKMSLVLGVMGFRSVKVPILNMQDFFGYVRRQDYDLIGGRYTGNFPDVDGYIDPIRMDSLVHFGNFPNQSYINKINSYRYFSNYEERSRGYMNAMSEMEKQNFWVPLYRIYLPIIHHKDVVVPDASFKYESELWKVIWQ